MNCAGIGKTTLAIQICLQWARDEIFADELDAVVMIPFRSVQERSLEEVIKQYVGEEDYPKLKKSAGSRCLLILEGLDEMAVNRQHSDLILQSLIKENTLLEKLIISRTHAYEKLVIDRRVGFGDKEIREFVNNSFTNDVESIEEFMRQLTDYPHFHSLCFVPLNLVMISDVFHFSQKKLPSTLTELYRLFIVMILQREVVKCCSVKKLTVGGNAEVTLCKMLAGIPKKAVGIEPCHIEDTGAKLLVRHYPNNNTTSQLLEKFDLLCNNLTAAGLENVMKIVRTSKPHYSLLIH